MKKLNEGNLYNIQTADGKKDRSDELADTKKVMMNQFWQSMSRQNITPELAKQIAKHTFGDSENTK